MLATAWLLDGVLQLQPSMFASGAHGLSGMLASSAAGNPGPVASSITWAASAIGEHSASTDLLFALVQIALGLGIAWRRSVKPALAASIPWALAVWWFGEGLGGVLHGAGSPVLGGPGAVLIYAVLAVVLWPSPARPAGAPVPDFAAASALGGPVAKALWAALWSGMAGLSLLGAARAPGGIASAIAGVDAGEPAWLATVDHHVAALAAGRGLPVAAGVAAVCLMVALAVYLPPAAGRGLLVLGIVTSLAIWMVTENFGAILAGGATDPNSGPLLVVLALAYWPARARRPAGAPGRLDAPALVPGGGAELALAPGGGAKLALAPGGGADLAGAG